METHLADGTEMAYWEAGHGPTALLLHGFALDHTMWLDQAAALAPVRRCVMPDLPGFGRSPLGPTARLDLLEQAAAVAGLLGSLGAGGPVDVVGHSFGGQVALRLWKRHPALVRSLILVGVTLLRDSPVPTARPPEIIAEGREAYAGGLVPRLVAPESSLFVRARTRSMLESVPYETLYAPADHAAEQAGEVDLLRRVDVPVLVLSGEQDRAAPPAAVRELASHVRDVRAVEVARAAHMLPVERPDEVSRAMKDFWTSRFGV